MKRILFILAALLTLAGCEKKPVPGKDIPYDRVAVLYSIARNNLSEDLENDIKELCDVKNGAYVPEYGCDKALIVVVHTPYSYYSYDKPTLPVMMNIYRDKSGSVVRDTVFSMSGTSFLTDSNVMRTFFNKVRELFPADHYGAILSSHGSGWLPGPYYSNGKMTTKSFGQEIQGEDQYLMDIQDLPDGLPFKLDYLLFDACLMGNVETVFELRQCADKIGVSATEVLSDGFNYLRLGRKLLGGDQASPEGVCKDFFEQYDIKTGRDKSACIALVKTSELPGLAEVCGRLFRDYSTEIQELDPLSVQRFFRYNGKEELLHHGWFYDLEDIIRVAGATEQELSELGSAIESCIIYKANTPEFMMSHDGYNWHGFTFEHFCGLGMSIPQFPSDEMRDWYRTLAWNEATGLVK